MDDLRLALVVVGLVVVVVVWALVRVSRRRSARRAQELDLAAMESQEEYGYDPDDSGTLDISPLGDASGPERVTEEGGTEADVGRLGGVFAATREVSDAEISIDVSILAGLRATYESTLDGTLDASVEEALALEPSEGDGVVRPSADAASPPPRRDGDPPTRTRTSHRRSLAGTFGPRRLTRVSGLRRPAWTFHPRSLFRST